MILSILPAHVGAFPQMSSTRHKLRQKFCKSKSPLFSQYSEKTQAGRCPMFYCILKAFSVAKWLHKCKMTMQLSFAFKDLHLSWDLWFVCEKVRLESLITGPSVFLSHRCCSLASLPCLTGTTLCDHVQYLLTRNELPCFTACPLSGVLEVISPQRRHIAAIQQGTHVVHTI